MMFRTSVLCPTSASDSVQNTACLRDTRAFSFSVQLEKFHKVEGLCLSEVHLLPAPTSVLFSPPKQQQKLPAPLLN